MILGLTAGQALLAAAVLALAVLPIGLWLSRDLAPVWLARSERLVLAVLIGYPASCVAIYLLARARVPFVVLPAGAGLFAVLALLRRARQALAARSVPAGRPGSAWLAAALVLVLALSLRSTGAFLEAGSGALRYEHSVDHTLFLSFYWELTRGVPPAELPTAAGVPFPAYHLLSMMPGLLLVDQVGLAPTVVFHVLSPLFRLFLFAAAMALAVRVRTNDVRAAAAALLATFVAGAAFDSAMNDRVVVGPPPLYDFLRNEPEGGGLALWATIFCLLALSDRSRLQAGDSVRHRRLLLTVSCLAGLSYAFKAQLFLLFGGAYAAALAVSWLRDRARLYLQALAAMGLTFLVFFWLSRGSGGVATLQFTPGLFAEWYIYPNLRRDPWPPLRAAADLLGGLPAGLGSLLAVLLAIWRVVGFSPLVPAFVVHALTNAKRLGLADAAAALALALSLPLGLFLSATSIYEEASPYEFRQAAHGLTFLGAALNVVALHGVLVRRALDGGLLLLGLAALASALALPILLGAPPYQPARAGITLSSDEQCVLVYLRTRTPIDAVVISARTVAGEDLRRLGHRLNHQAVVAAFAGRRAVLEYYGREVDQGRDRERDIKRFFTTEDAELAERILKRYTVDYVLESALLPLRFPTQALAKVFERGSFRAYAFSVRARAGLASELPRAFRASDGLCEERLPAR